MLRRTRREPPSAFRGDRGVGRLGSGGRLGLDEGDGMQAEHGPRAAGGEIAEHLPGGPIQESGAVCFDELLDLGFGPVLGYPDQADDMDFGGVVRLFAGRRQEP